MINRGFVLYGMEMTPISNFLHLGQNLALLSRSCFLSLTVIAPMKKSHVHFLQGSEKTALPDLLENWKGEEL